MRDCFGNGTLVALPGGYGITATGLHKPLALVFDDGATPDLSSVVDKPITFVGALPLISGNLEELSLHVVELQVAADDAVITPVFAVVAGNLGKAPELNPKGDRVGASIAYADGAWLRLAAYPYYSCTDKLKEQEAGRAIVVYGTIETYEYKDSDRLQLAVYGFGITGGASTARKPTVLYSKASPSAGAALPTDAFTAAS